MHSEGYCSCPVCLRGIILKHKILSDHDTESMNSTKVQNPRRNSYAGLTFNSSYIRTYITLALCVYTAHARASVSLPRVGLRLYLACFTPVAPVASL